MSRTLALIVVAALVALVAAPAQARPRDSAREIRALKTQLREARATIRSKSRALERRADALTDARNRLAQAAREIATLQTTVTTRTAERDQARQAARRPTELERAVTQVSREVTYAQMLDASWPREALVAHVAMNYVAGHVTAAAYGYLNAVSGTPPAATAESVLAAGAGICGHASLTYAAILHRFNIPVRSVQFYYPDNVNNHIAVEVYYGGGWHYYDPTWDAYYADGDDVLSITEARSRPDAQSLLPPGRCAVLALGRAPGGHGGAGWETDQATRVEIDSQPFPY